MSGLIVFLVAFAGIGGKHAEKKIDQQVEKLLFQADEVERISMSKPDRHELVTHGEMAADIVAAVGAQGVIAGEVDRSGKRPVLRVVVYDAEGTRIDLVEITLAKKAKKLTKDNLEQIAEVVLGDIQSLNTPPKPPEPEPIADPEPVADVETLPDAVEVVSGTRKAHEARVKISAGGGTRSRTFEPGPLMALGLRSSQVPGAQVAAEVRPVKYLAIGGELERTLTMHSQVDSDSVASSILGWQATVALRLPLGPIELAALGGVGARHFVLGADTSPTPDAHYVHAVVGGRVAVHAGKKVELRAFGAYEPVIGGEDTMMGAARTGFEVGGAIEVTATPHLFVVGEGGFQRFTSTWNEGSATDDYPSATLSMGAMF